MYNKTDIFNLALSALYLQKKIADSETDQSNEAKTLRTHWIGAYHGALAEMDLDHTATTAALTLIVENPNSLWKYAYTYPSDCVYIRRIVNDLTTDDNETKVDRKVGTRLGVKVIFANQYDAELEYISSSVLPQSLSVEAAMYVAYKLALLAMPLIVGKDSKEVAGMLLQLKAQAFADAVAKDSKETNIYQPEYARSEFVKARLS